MPGLTVDAAGVASRLEAIRRRIRLAGGDPAKVVVVAVTKGHGPEAAVAAVEAGLTEIGENYANELLAKVDEVSRRCPGATVHWHYLGAIQRNKIPRLAPLVSCWQSVARAEEAVAIARRTPPSRRPEIFVEIDLSGAPGRRGCPPEDGPAVVEAARQAGCDVRGLMTVAPLPDPAATADEQDSNAAEAFGRVARLASVLGVGELSMGMTHDLEQAVAAGSTMIRVGTALFGEREGR